MLDKLEGETIALLSRQATILEMERYIGHVLIEAGVTSYKLAWLDEQKRETKWLEHQYHYQFQTQKELVNYQQRDILVCYYNTEIDVAKIWSCIRVLVLNIYLATAYRTKNDRRYMRQDLELASKMQQMLVPKNLFCNPSFCASGLYVPNFQVGGDFYDVIPINEYKIGFCIGDISGKGINAAIMMSYFIGFIRSTLLAYPRLEDTVNIINEKIYELTEGEKFITLFLGVYNIEDKRLVYINSGHVPIPLYHQDSLEWLEAGTTILGAMKQLPFIELGKIKLKEKQNLFLYTDGLLNMSIDHEPFLSQSELTYMLRNDCHGMTPYEITDYFQIKSKAITVADDLKDDISLLVISLG